MDDNFATFLDLINIAQSFYFRKTGADLSISGLGLVGVVNVGGRHFLVGELQNN